MKKHINSFETFLQIQIRMMRQNHQHPHLNGGRHGGQNGHSHAELVSGSAASHALHEIPLASNSTHLTVPSFTSHAEEPSSAVLAGNSKIEAISASGIQIKDSEIV